MDTTTQQATTEQVSTGNPQDISAQSGALQNASPQSVEQIRALDQSADALQVSGVSNSISLAGIAVTSTTSVSQPSQPSSISKDAWLYTGIGLVLVVFVAILAYSMFKPHHSK